MARTQLAVLAVILGLALPAAHAVTLPPLKQPAWVELSAEEKQILAPLSEDWDALVPWRKKKWVGIARRYPAMTSDEQARVQRRMKDWAVLSAEERKAAREKYKALQKASPEHKESLVQKWQEYRQLPEDEKQRLRDEAAKARPQPKPGAARRPPPAPALPAALPAPSPVIAAPAEGVAPTVPPVDSPPATENPSAPPQP